MPMDEVLNKLLKEGGGPIFESFLENVPTSHTVSLALFMCAYSDSACHALA